MTYVGLSAVQTRSPLFLKYVETPAVWSGALVGSGSHDGPRHPWRA